MRKILYIIGLAFSFVAFSQSHSPVGTWLTIDDRTGNKKSMVELYEKDGRLEGKVVDILTPPINPKGHICDKCSGDRKNQPIQGMVIMWGYEKSGDMWKSGEIIDPKNGKVYSSQISMSKDGKKLYVRGYLGISLIGRTQTWHRE